MFQSGFKSLHAVLQSSIPSPLLTVLGEGWGTSGSHAPSSPPGTRFRYGEQVLPGREKVSFHQLLHLVNKSSQAGDTVAPSAEQGQETALPERTGGTGFLRR